MQFDLIVGYYNCLCDKGTPLNCIVRKRFIEVHIRNKSEQKYI